MNINSVRRKAHPTSQYGWQTNQSSGESDPEHWRMKPVGRAWLFCIKIECRPVMDTVTTDSSDEVQ